MLDVWAQGLMVAQVALGNLASWRSLLDTGLALVLIYVMLVIIGERRTLWMVRGFLVLLLAVYISDYWKFKTLNFVLSYVLFGSAVAMAIILQSEFRRFLEQLGRGELLKLLQPASSRISKTSSITEELVEAVKELSQNRIGALMIVEISAPMDERDFSVPGVRLNAELSKELIQTIFQPSTLLHDGAMLVRDSRVAAAGIILPLSDRTASRQLGTRHRAAMGITERVESCVCIVVSEETGSISLAENGILHRPLTSNKLRDLLEERLGTGGDRRDAAGRGGWRSRLGHLQISRLLDQMRRP